MSEPNTETAEEPGATPQPVPPSNEGSGVGVSENPKGPADYGAEGQVEDEPADSRRP